MGLMKHSKLCYPLTIQMEAYRMCGIFISFFPHTFGSLLVFVKMLHIVVPLAYLSSSSKFEWAENAEIQARTKKFSGKQICSTTKWFL